MPIIHGRQKRLFFYRVGYTYSL
ncbi:hypothetical protein YPPY103_1302, partial [Yersinia pestis PY-103]